MSDAHVVYDRSAAFAQQVIGDLPPDALGAQSLCEGWTVEEVVRHLIGGQHYFAAAALGHGMEPPPEGGDDPAEGDPVAAHGQAALSVSTAFTDDVLAGMVETVRGTLPGSVLFGIATLENVVHALDAGRGAGLDISVPEDIGEAVLAIAAATAPNARGNGFADEVEVDADADVTARILAMTGRTP